MDQYHTHQQRSALQNQDLHLIPGQKLDKQLNEDFQHACKVLNIDPLTLQAKSLNDFMEGDKNSNLAQIRYEHYDKRRKIKLKMIQEFITNLRKKQRAGTAVTHHNGRGNNQMITLSLLPKDDLRKSKNTNMNHSYITAVNERYESPVKVGKGSRTHKGSISQHPSQSQSMMLKPFNAYSQNNNQSSGGNKAQNNNQSATNIFDLTSAAAGNEEPAGKTAQSSIINRSVNNLYGSTQEDRYKQFSLKTAKRDKKLEKDFKQRKEEHEWKVMQKNQKIQNVIQRKKLIEMEDEAKRQKKFEDYLAKTNLFTQKHKSFSSRESLNRQNNQMNAQNSDEDFVTYDQQPSLERQIAERLRRYEERMERASANRRDKLERERVRLQSQNQTIRDKRNFADTSKQQREYSTLQRYCDRQTKSRKVLKRKTEEKQEMLEWKRGKEIEKQGFMKLRLQEQDAQYQSKVNQSLVITDKAADRLTLYFEEQEQGKRVKRGLREQDQRENRNRILLTQKQEKRELMQALQEKERRFKGFQEFRKSIQQKHLMSSSQLRSAQNLTINHNSP